MSYIKPNVSFQPMTLLGTISGTCSNGIDHADEICMVLDPDNGEDVIFTSVCPIKVNPDEPIGDHCYHVPYSSSSFMS